MKRIVTVLIAILFIANVFLPVSVTAQAPQKMSYQAVIRTAGGQLVTNQTIGMRIKILQGSAVGTAVYTETQQPATNANGLVTLEIGTGTTADDFSTIDWANGPYYIKTETDPSGGTNYSITGVSQLLSVPYALSSKGLTLPFANSSSYSSTPFSVENTGSSYYTIAGYSNIGYGIYGKTKATNAAGVYGVGTGSDYSSGVVGLTGEGITTTLPGNSGVLGQSNEHIGVAGTAVAGTGGYFSSKTGNALYTKGLIQLTGIGEAANRILSTDASGLATWTDPVWQSSGGNAYYDLGKVGIGTGLGTTLYSLLELNGNSYQSDIHIFNTTTGFTNFDGLKVGYGSYGYLWNYENTDLIFGTNSLERLTIKANGNIGMGTSMPNYKLDVTGNLNLNRGITSGAALYCNAKEALWFDGTYFSWGYGGTWNFFGDKVFIGDVAADPGANMLVVNGAAAKPGGGSWATWSDIRLKNIQGKYERGLKEILSLQPVRFTYKKGNPCNLPSDQDYVGFVAQDVQKVFPEAIGEGSDGYLTLDANSINVALVNAVKELKAENDAMKASLARLEALLHENAEK
jgi:hypothetical protein